MCFCLELVPFPGWFGGKKERQQLMHQFGHIRPHFERGLELTRSACCGFQLVQHILNQVSGLSAASLNMNEIMGVFSGEYVQEWPSTNKWIFGVGGRIIPIYPDQSQTGLQRPSTKKWVHQLDVCVCVCACVCLFEGIV